MKALLLWIVVVGTAGAGGFAGGYFHRYQELHDLRQRLAQQQADAQVEIARLELDRLGLENMQLEQELNRATLAAALREVLARLPSALVEIEQIGRATRDLDLARVALEDPALPGATRDELARSLESLLSRLEQLDEMARSRVAASSDELERVASGLTSSASGADDESGLGRTQVEPTSPEVLPSRHPMAAPRGSLEATGSAPTMVLPSPPASKYSRPVS